MAGDWIKMRSNLDTNPKVVSMACDLNTTELHVVGMLWKVWAWADEHSIDGNAVCVTDSFLDRLVSVTDFSIALRKVGWLEGRSGQITFPRFAEHNGQTAKKRAETNARVALHRAILKRSCNAESVTESVTREEKRREELTHTHTTGPPKGDFLFPKCWTDRCREQWEAWQSVRHRDHGSRMSAIQWEAEAQSHDHLTEPQWFEALLLSTRKGSKGLCVEKFDRKPSGSPQRPYRASID